MFAALALLGTAAVAAAKQHPTLPEQWIATTNEPEMGVGVEAYNFVAVPDYDNPSTLWSNYTDQGCERLIYIANNYDANRYLFGCDAIDCCNEPQDGNQVEFQIPNVHLPGGKSVNVTYGGVWTLDQFGEQIEADMWSWDFAPGTPLHEHWDAYTTDCDECVNGVQLHLWSVVADGERFNITFKDYQGVKPEDMDAFKASFNRPSEESCRISCDDDDQEVPEKKEGKQHPTLPTAWVATTNEPEVGVGVEAYLFVDKPTHENPSAIWSNYTDQGCERLIYVPNQPEATRYLFGCDAVNCCYESQEGNHKEYQIPDAVVFGKPAEVTYDGAVEIESFGEKVTADAWSWEFMKIRTTAFTTEDDDGVKLHLWRSNITYTQQVFDIEFKDFQGIKDEDLPAFKEQFHAPDHHDCRLECM